MNVAAITGRLTRDPELRYTESGTAVCSYTLAVRNPFKPDEPDFIQCVTWQKMGELIAETHRKGQFLCVTGRIQTRNYEDNDGVRRYVTEINTDQVTFVTSAPHQEEESEPEPPKNTNKGKSNTQNDNRNKPGNGNQNRGNSPRQTKR